jgi:flagellar biosynthesis protein FliQ
MQVVVMVLEMTEDLQRQPQQEQTLTPTAQRIAVLAAAAVTINLVAQALSSFVIQIHSKIQYQSLTAQKHQLQVGLFTHSFHQAQ